MAKRRSLGGLLCAAALVLFGVLARVLFRGYGITALALAFLGLVCAFYTLTAYFRKRRLRLAGTLALLVCLSCFAAAEIPVIAGARSDADVSADWLVVMGAGIQGEEPSPSLQDRLEAALAYLEAHPETSCVVSGSQAEDEIVSEASVMRDWLLERGLSPDRVFLEPQADSTFENVRYSLCVIDENGGNRRGRVAFLSSEYHLCRIRILAAALGCEPVCVAARTAMASMRLNQFVREALAIWEIWVFGPGA